MTFCYLVHLVLVNIKKVHRFFIPASSLLVPGADLADVAYLIWSSMTRQDKIKRPRNSFILFRSWLLQHRPLEGVNALPLGPGALSKIAATRWAALSPEETQFWSERAQQEKIEHGERHPDYVYQPAKNTERAKQLANEKAARDATGSKKGNKGHLRKRKPAAKRARASKVESESLSSSRSSTPPAPTALARENDGIVITHEEETEVDEPVLEQHFSRFTRSRLCPGPIHDRKASTNTSIPPEVTNVAPFQCNQEEDDEATGHLVHTAVGTPDDREHEQAISERNCTFLPPDHDQTSTLQYSVSASFEHSPPPFISSSSSFTQSIEFDRTGSLLYMKGLVHTGLQQDNGDTGDQEDMNWQIEMMGQGFGLGQASAW